MSLAQQMAAMSLTYLRSDLSLSEDKKKVHIEFDSVTAFQQRFVHDIGSILPERCVELFKELNVRDIPVLGNLSQFMPNGDEIKINILNPLRKILNKVARNSVNSVDAVSYVNQKQIKHGPHDVSITICSGGETKHVITNTEALMGLVIAVQSYPVEWWDPFFWDAWLAVTIQLHLLVTLHLPNTVPWPDTLDRIFPTLWFKNIFDAERLCGKPEDVKCLLLGQDPVSNGQLYTKATLRKATGIAFHAIGNNNASIEKMKTYYDLNCDDNNPKTHCGKGLLLVNMIRCIPENRPSVDGNPYHDAWVAYTMKLACYCATDLHKKVVVMCRFDNDITKLYLPAAVGCAYEDAAAPHGDPLLLNTPYCIIVSHPSHTTGAAAVDAADDDKFKNFVPVALRQI